MMPIHLTACVKYPEVSTRYLPSPKVDANVEIILHMSVCEGTVLKSTSDFKYNDRNQVADQRFSLSDGLLSVLIVEGSEKQKNR